MNFKYLYSEKCHNFLRHNFVQTKFEREVSKSQKDLQLQKIQARFMYQLKGENK